MYKNHFVNRKEWRKAQATQRTSLQSVAEFSYSEYLEIKGRYGLGRGVKPPPRVVLEWQEEKRKQELAERKKPFLIKHNKPS